MKRIRKVKIESLDRLLLAGLKSVIERRQGDGQMLYYSYKGSVTNDKRYPRFNFEGIVESGLPFLDVLRKLSVKIEDEPIQLV